MAAICYSSIKGLVMRITRIDACGRWLAGLTGSATSCGFVTFTATANLDEGEEFEVKTANGDLCISEKDCPRLKWYDMDLEFCQVDPEFFELLSGNRILEDYAGTSVGYAVGESVRCDGGFALEIWTQVAGGSCGGGNSRWVYWLFPNVVNAIIGDYTIENGPTSFTFSANSRANANWGVGPYDVVAENVGLTPGPLLDVGVLDDEHLYTRLTEIEPPDCVCGYVAQLVPHSDLVS